MEDSTTTQRLKEVTQCSICISNLVDPKALPCIHTFCFACLEKYASQMQKKPGDEMPCPICRKMFTVPTTGLTGLPNNFFIQDILESLRITAEDEVKIECDVCMANEDFEFYSETAEFFCVECRENLCELCSTEHRRQKLSRGHQIVSIGSRTNEELLRHSPVSLCNQHHDKPQEIYCLNCKSVICVMCFVESHKFHDCSDIKNVAEQFRPQLGLTSTKFKTYETEALTKKSQLDKDKTEMLRSIDNTEIQIRDRKEAAIALIEEHTNKLLEELELLKRSNLKNYDCAKEQIENHLAILNSFENYSEVLKSRGSPVDICRSINGLENTGRDIDQSHQVLLNQKIAFSVKNFKITSLQNLLQERNIIGALEDLPERSLQPDKCSEQVKFDSKFDIQVCIRDAKGQRLLLLTNLLSPVEKFVRQVSAVVGVELKHVRIYYQGKQLDLNSKCTLRDCQIQHLSSIDVCVQ